MKTLFLSTINLFLITATFQTDRSRLIAEATLKIKQHTTNPNLQKTQQLVKQLMGAFPTLTKIPSLAEKIAESQIPKNGKTPTQQNKHTKEESAKTNKKDNLTNTLHNGGGDIKDNLHAFMPGNLMGANNDNDLLGSSSVPDESGDIIDSSDVVTVTVSDSDISDDTNVSSAENENKSQDGTNPDRGNPPSSMSTPISQSTDADNDNDLQGDDTYRSEDNVVDDTDQNRNSSRRLGNVSSESEES